MRIIEVHVPYLHSFRLWLDKLHQQLGGILSPWALMLSTSPTDDIWFCVYRMGYTVAILHLDWDETKKKCKITIHSTSDTIEQNIVDYWEAFDWQMIDLKPPASLPPRHAKRKFPPLINWSPPISCPNCYAVYRYPRSMVESGTIECQNCGRKIEY